MCRMNMIYQLTSLRSKTQVTRKSLVQVKNLLAIGCFCIGTDKVDLQASLSLGIAVFNSPFANSRSVAELVICEIIALARQLPKRLIEMCTLNQWSKTSNGCFEVRGKTLGIVGYGHIGSQLSVIAESLGMRVIYHDIAYVMPLGGAVKAHSLPQLLGNSDFISLHVPNTPETEGMIGEKEISQMRKSSYLINASRGKVVDLLALKVALESGSLAGAAIDVFPSEPKANGSWDSPIFFEKITNNHFFSISFFLGFPISNSS